jgi:hypothetical protein
MQTYYYEYFNGNGNGNNKIFSIMKIMNENEGNENIVEEDNIVINNDEKNL